MEIEVSEYNKNLSKEFSNQVVSECMKIHFKGMSQEIGQQDKDKIEQCMRNFMFSFGIVAEAWNQQLESSEANDDN